MVPKSVLPPSWEVPAEFRNRLGERVGRQRAMMADGHLLLVLHRPPKKDEVERFARLFWRKPDGTWQSNELGNGPTALVRHLGDFAELIDKYDRQEDQAQSVDDYFGIMEGISPLTRAVKNLHSVLQDAREKLPDERDLINVRDKAYELERSAELLATDVRNALEFATAKKSEEQAAASHEMAIAAHRLNLLAAFFFPIATLSAVFDTSLTHPLEKYIPPPYAFYSVIGLGLFLGVVLAAYLAGPAEEDKKRPA
ncbi:MAG: hypothetical protein L0211_25130 [Planctomycetaceae bacterium]|nr:hypothetical protein [Planctomycetaceae bacterium]